jgi:signal transduction histidine kinase
MEKEKILVIDDTDFIREDIQTTLMFEGYTAIIAEDGLAGVEKARAEKPDLILCDVSMPRLDGFGALEQIRATPDLTTTPFIFLTAKAEKQDMRRGMELGADDYLTKPFTTDELIKAVETQLEKRRKVAKVFGNKIEEELQRAFDNILYALPHEFRTPLNGLLGLSSVMLSLVRESKDAGEQLAFEDIESMTASIHDSAKRLHHLAENFLVYTQILSLEKGTRSDVYDANQRAIGLYGTVSGVIESQAPVYGRLADVKMEVEEVELALSMQNFYKIVDELASNAFKFSDVGTPIIVRGFMDGERWTLEITDHGRGIKTEDLERIGQPFHQVGRREHEQQGAGLGLAIVQKLVKLHNGVFSIESDASDENHHTTVRVTLGIAPPEEY